MISTEFTRAFGVDHPIVCGGMTGFGTAPLISAVANAGALGFLADVAELASGARGRQRVLVEGDVEGGVWWAGQTQGLIDEVASCRQVIDTIVAEAEAIIGTRLPACTRRACATPAAPSADRRPSPSSSAPTNAMKVTTDAVQVLGGAGYTRDSPVERYMRETKVMQIFEGTNQIQRLVISRNLGR
jgi:hypothetical protein